jgi:hypothetical protein
MKAWRNDLTEYKLYVRSVVAQREEYSYTGIEAEAMELTLEQCETFVKYMLFCDTQGYYSA